MLDTARARASNLASNLSFNDTRVSSGAAVAAGGGIIGAEVSGSEEETGGCEGPTEIASGWVVVVGSPDITDTRLIGLRILPGSLRR